MSNGHHAACILVVDDDQRNLRAAEAVLEPLGHELVLARSGAEALAALADADVAVAILDVVMPGMGGFDVARIMRSRPATRTTPILFLTAADGDGRDALKGYLHGGADYLVKPFEPAVLRAKVSVFVELHLARESARQLAREEERRANAERERQRLETLLMHAPVAVAVLDGPEQRIELANDRLRVLGDRGELVGRPFAEAFPELAGSALAALVERTRADGQPRSLSAFAVRLDCRGDGVADDCWFDFTVAPLPDDAGRRVVWTAIDVSDHVRARRAREDFLSVASHELKTPLTTLHLQADVLDKHAADGGCFCGTVSAKLPLIRRQITRLERLVDELLDVSRLVAGKLPLTLEEVDAVGLVRDVVDRLGDEARRAGCDVVLTGEERVVGSWDRMRLDHIITNLVTNALKYGAGRPIEVRVAGDGDQARIAIADHGIGIAPRDQARIFERFERAVTQGNVSGAGVGLWIVSRFVTELGGRIRVESQPRAGATFIVELPRAAPADG